MDDEELLDRINDKIRSVAAEQARAVERALLDALDAPIFVRLMTERQQNPLGIERWQGDPVELHTFDGTVLRFEQPVGFMQMRPEPKRLV